MAAMRIQAARRVGALAGGALVALLLALAAFPTARADPTPTLTIQTPAPNGTTSEGPVGANVTIAGQGFTPSDTLVIGYASVDQGCVVGDVPLTPQANVTVVGDGTFTYTFAWPSATQNIGTSYFVCATDSTTAATPLPVTVPVQSTQQYKVDASQAPSITLTPGPGPDGATPVPGQSSFIIGGQITLTASNYQPGGMSLKALLLKGQYTQHPSDFTDPSVVTLATTNSSAQLMADSTGTLSASLVLPSSLAEGKYWVYLVSSDGSPTVAPSLVAGLQIAVQKPTPTPTPTNTPTPRVSPTPTPSGGGKPVAAIVGLGGLSLLFLILGIVFLASAAAIPRQPLR